MSFAGVKLRTEEYWFSLFKVKKRVSMETTRKAGLCFISRCHRASFSRVISAKCQNSDQST